MTQLTDDAVIPESGRSLLVDLALQGGGSHGAFTWGVLDRLLDEEWLQFDGISGTSAGAMNAAVMLSGLERGGRNGARDALASFWRAVADAALLSPLKRGFLDVLMGNWSLVNSPTFVALDLAARLWSPYDLNPGGNNPLGGLLESHVDFTRLAASKVKLFVTATNVRTGRGRVFRNAELSPAVLLASACLPSVFHAVEIDGESYWDGGYAGNPTITPLVRDCDSRDTILVQINPVERHDIPRDARAINSRINELSFNAPLLKELRMIAMLRGVVDAGQAEGRKWARMRIHRIGTDAMERLDASSKMLAEWGFFCMLKDEGRRAADAFLRAHAADLGERSTLDLDALLEGV
ncbi:patatin-like phospholipase family protein [Uliginosibacterium sp. H3]|uniref:Patatin-like phospholipase family protein n=1 Tax=Uliginosibacterium silvisoli TaxID=3114758 RepID=A0ABU6K106_9RHOO|nr:patatin-like phospholipase family protein [Uliginosibacterium sp. H3]